MNKYIALLIFGLIAFVAAAPICGTYVHGKKVDLSPLRATNGSYTFSATWNGTLYDFELQVCGNVVTHSKGCTVPSPVNQINAQTGECTYVGDLTTTAWDEDPSGNGVYVTYYHGQNVDSVIHRAARIYFECDKTQVGSPSFEHVTDCGQYHFSWKTKYVCFQN
eukprot:TRINITY_DN1379_c0_g1_i1.p1 TRINITY_DN1379_c0_g1~~TRINITY_DN1379_c0_g1_i1.p1  ORF type:complete len:164 (+),score=43.89 TRINITY_DN1379_c0_g1_i1:29-520(+)